MLNQFVQLIHEAVGAQLDGILGVCVNGHVCLHGLETALQLLRISALLYGCKR